MLSEYPEKRTLQYVAFDIFRLVLHYAYVHGLPQFAFELIKCSDRAVSTAEFPRKPPRSNFDRFQQSCMSLKKIKKTFHLKFWIVFGFKTLQLVLTNCCGKNNKVIVKIAKWFSVGQ